MTRLRVLLCLVIAFTSSTVGTGGSMSLGFLVQARAASASNPAPQAQIFNPGPANRTATGHAPSNRTDKLDSGQELTSLRTRTSRTLITRQGYEFYSYSHSINFLDSGVWKPIDTSLVPMAGGYRNKANSFELSMPSDLKAGPEQISMARDSVAYQLVGAAGQGVVSDSTATFSNALPGTTLVVISEADGVKENLVLASASAPANFEYTLKLSSGLSAQANEAGGITFLKNGQPVPFSFAAPTVVDAASAAGPVSLSLSSPTQVKLSVDGAWLSQASRRWPVTIDPTVTITYSGSSIVKTYTGASQDCYLKSSTPTTSQCNGTSLNVGYNGTGIERALLQFNISIPQDANVLESDLAVQLSATSSSAAAVELHPVTQAWTTGATWNAYDGTNAWTTAGGTYSNPATWTTTVGTATGTYHWYLTALTQTWVNGSATNDGVLLKAASETTSDELTFYSSESQHSSNWPVLKVIYQLGIGELPYYRMETQQLSDHLTIETNVSSGNLVAHLKLLDIKGTGVDNTFDLFWNVLSPSMWDFGRSWITNTAWDPYVDPKMGDGASFFGPSGWAFHFMQNADGTYATSGGIDATLTHNQDGTYTVTFHATGEKYNFTSNGLSMTSEVDRNGNAIRFAYDAHGALSSMTDSQGRVTTFGYVTGSYTNCGPPTASGFVNLITDPVGRKYQFTYDTNCDLTTYNDPNNRKTTFGYDSNLNLAKITDPLGNVTNLTYNSIFKVTSITRVTNLSNQTGYTTSYTYNPSNTVSTDPNSHQWTYYPDAKDRVVQETDPLGHQVNISYTGNSDVSQYVDGAGSTTSASYDINNNLTQVSPTATAQGRTPATIKTSFAAPGQPYLASSTTDSQGNCRAFAYDGAGNLVHVYDGQASPCDGLTGGTELTNTYQSEGGSCGGINKELCSVTDGNGHVTSYAYDSHGNLTTITPPSPLGATTIVPDSVSRVSSTTDGKGQRTTLSYDALDRVTQILYNGATTCSSSSVCTTQVYDADGNLASRTDASGTTTFTYDMQNRLIDKSLPDTSFACAGSSPLGITFAYDGVGNLTSYCDSGGSTAYSYDPADRVSGLAEPGGSCSGTVSLCTSFAYDGDNRPTWTTYPGGATMNLAYDPAGNLSSAIGKSSTGTVLTSFTYTFNLGTSDTRLAQTVAEADPVFTGTTTYTYDTHNRLAKASNTNTTLNYGYDAAGNRASDPGGTHTFNAANEITDSGYTFDANGNETAGPSSQSFSYNAQNQTTSATGGGTTLSGLTYAGLDESERTATNQGTFAAGQRGVTISKATGSSTYFIRDNIGGPVGERTPDGNHWYYLRDRLGSIVAVINGSGSTVANRYGYDPFGKPTYTTTTVANPFGFAGGFLDATGLVKFGTRYYDPKSGRWTQQDPVTGSILSSGSLNRYSYVACDPVNSTDPTGKWCQALINEAAWFLSQAYWMVELAGWYPLWSEQFMSEAGWFFAAAAWFWFWGVWWWC